MFTVRTIGAEYPLDDMTWQKGLLWLIHYGEKNKMCRHCENSSKLLTVENESASEYAISHIHSNIPDYLQ